MERKLSLLVLAAVFGCVSACFGTDIPQAEARISGYIWGLTTPII